MSEQPKKEYVVFEMSLVWHCFETLVLTKQELEEMMIAKLYSRLSSSSVVDLSPEYFDDHIYQLVETGHESVFVEASIGIVSVVRLSDGKVWGKSGQRRGESGMCTKIF